MPQYFFRFDPMAEEIERKLESMSAAPDMLFAALLDRAQSDGLSTDDAHRLGTLFETLCDTPFDKHVEHPLNHPVRVAATWWTASDRKDYETLALALCHNIRENGGDAASAIERAALARESCDAIATLTIDRSRERDPAYLTAYYHGIDAAPGGLMILKGFDKLDNFLSYPLYDLGAHHFRVIDDYVTPRLLRKAPRLAAYLQEVADYVRTDAAKARYRKTEAKPA